MYIPVATVALGLLCGKMNSVTHFKVYCTNLIFSIDAINYFFPVYTFSLLNKLAIKINGINDGAKAETRKSQASYQINQTSSEADSSEA